MYAHQVIEDINFEKKLKVVGEETIKILSNMIKNSFKFNMGNQDNIESVFKKLIGSNKVFLDNPQYLKFPYKLCWFEYFGKDINGIDFKSCILAEQIKDEVSTVHFGYAKNEWFPLPFGALIKIGNKFDDIDGNFKWVELYKNKLDIYKYVGVYIAPDLSFLDMSIRFLNCKNISTEKNYPPEALNKKRIKQGKQPLFTYHTLVVNPMNSKQRSEGPHEPTGIKQRLHFCRGHFKEYTDSNKLFGKHTGLYWWQPMVRGNKELGLVHKDYEVRASVNA